MELQCAACMHAHCPGSSACMLKANWGHIPRCRGVQLPQHMHVHLGRAGKRPHLFPGLSSRDCTASSSAWAPGQCPLTPHDVLLHLALPACTFQADHLLPAASKGAVDRRPEVHRMQMWVGRAVGVSSPPTNMCTNRSSIGYRRARHTLNDLVEQVPEDARCISA